MDKRIWWGLGAAAGAVVIISASVTAVAWMAAGANAPDVVPGADGGFQASLVPAGAPSYGPGDPSQEPAGQGGDIQQARQALQGLAAIRQQQCQMGNTLACQALPGIPQHDQRLVQLDQGCRRGDRNACGEFQTLSQQIFTAYSESAAVMQAGEDGMARMNAWRAQMNQNAATSMANLQAQGARGQAAHEARQEMYAGMNQAYAARDAASDRNQGRYVDGIYGGTTYDGGGVQGRVDYGSTGYTDGNGNMVAVPNGGQAPDGYSQMNETYASPD